MKFILIILVHVQGGYTMSLQEFDNQPACQRVMAEIEKFEYSPLKSRPQMKCVSKG